MNYTLVDEQDKLDKQRLEAEKKEAELAVLYMEQRKQEIGKLGSKVLRYSLILNLNIRYQNSFVLFSAYVLYFLVAEGI